MKAGWEERKIGDVCNFQRGLTFKRADGVEFSSKGVLRANNINKDTGTLNLSDIKYIREDFEVPAAKIVSKGCLLICTASGSKKHLGKVALIDIDESYAFGGFMGQLKPAEEILSKFLYYFTRSDHYFKYIQSLTDGANINNLRFNQLSELKIALPPLEEQKRIVAILDDAFEGLDRARAHTEANLQNAKDLIESYVENALGKTGAAAVSLQTLLDNNSITSHLDGNHGGQYPRKSEFVSSGVPYISANCIKDNELSFDKCKFLTPERAKTLRKGVARNNDVIFAHNATVGPVTLLKTEEEKVILSTSLTYYRCNPEKIYPQFLVYEMRGSNFKRQYETVMRQSTRNQVPITTQRKFFHTIPSISDQIAIADKCYEIEIQTRKLIKEYESKLKDLDDLRQSLLQKAFAGELT